MSYKIITGFSMIAVFLAFMVAVFNNDSLRVFFTALFVIAWLFVAIGLLLSS